MILLADRTFNYLARREEEARPTAEGEGRGASVARATTITGGANGEEKNGETRMDVYYAGDRDDDERERARGLLARQEARRQDPDC